MRGVALRNAASAAGLLVAPEAMAAGHTGRRPSAAFPGGDMGDTGYWRDVVPADLAAAAQPLTRLDALTEPMPVAKSQPVVVP